MSAQLQSAPIGAAALENFARYAYQSAHTPTADGRVAPLPLTLDAALAEAYARGQEAQEPIQNYADRRGE
jgi:hypothetical protein